MPAAPSDVQTVSVVVPVYQGEKTLPKLLEEIAPLTSPVDTPLGYRMRVTQIILVNDRGPDDSATVMRALAAEYPIVELVWLSTNFGQHAATLAGMSASDGEWIVTLDEDGQHDPAAIPGMLDTAMERGVNVVYAKPTNAAPHGVVRNLVSRLAKKLLTLFSGKSAVEFQSYRLVLGEVGRRVADYAGASVYLDVALAWIAGPPATSPVVLRAEGDRVSGYSARRLFGHFWRMVLTSGTRGLRLVSAVGFAFAVVGIGLSVWVVLSRLFGHDIPEGWASTIIVILFCSGAIMFSLGIIAEYIGVAVTTAMGRPAFFVVDDPAAGPFGRTARVTSSALKRAPRNAESDLG